MFNKVRSILAIGALSLTLVGIGAGANASPVLTPNASIQLSVSSGLKVSAGYYGAIQNVNVYSSTKDGCYSTFRSLVKGIEAGKGVVIANTACKNLNPWPWQKDKWHSKISYRSWIK